MPLERAASNHTASRASIIGALDVFLVGGLKGERRA